MELTLPPRENLGVFPTPLIKMPELAGVLGIEHLWAKRDAVSYTHLTLPTILLV